MMANLLKLAAFASRARSAFSRNGQLARRAGLHRSQFYSDIWREAANENGAQIDTIENDLFSITRERRSIKVFRNYTPLDDPVTLRLAGNKVLVHQALRDRGLPTPAYAEFSLACLKPASRFLQQYRCCVVKPVSGTGAGQGVTTGIKTRRHLVKAAVSAAGYNGKLMIEQQITGDNLRLLYLDGCLLDAIKRCPPTITGDGRSTIRQLLKCLNEQRISGGYHAAQAILRYDFEMRRTLAEQNLSLRSVPAAGRQVVLKSVVNDNMACENISVTDQVSPEVVEAGRIAAEAIGVRLAGVDIVTPNVFENLNDAGGAVLEVNTTPGLYFHYFNRGPAVRVAIPILAACLEQARPRDAARQMLCNA